MYSAAWLPTRMPTHLSCALCEGSHTETSSRTTRNEPCVQPDRRVYVVQRFLAKSLPGAPKMALQHPRCERHLLLRSRGRARPEIHHRLCAVIAHRLVGLTLPHKQTWVGGWVGGEWGGREERPYLARSLANRLLPAGPKEAHASLRHWSLHARKGHTPGGRDCSGTTWS